MNLQERIEADFIAALKGKKESEVSILRLLKAALKNARISKMKDLTEADAEKVIRSEIKKMQDSIVEYKRGGREDLADKEEREIAILKKYLPAELAEEELKKIVDEAVKSLNASAPADFGKVMKEVVKMAAGRAGGNKLAEVVKNKLGG
ncbi:MAG: GatB/YqeY domain-containing protein [Patescibacteria group bacterium]|nr:GatB/YqeY domain-containing protein [Patescibacteria group bacterium]MDD5490240.1 GatB/YqeY domain-containing protein [Patescibacteria group bacterium]